MGLNWAYVVPFRAERVDAVLTRLAGILDEPALVLDRLPWAPAVTWTGTVNGAPRRVGVGLRGLERHGKPGQSQCLTFRTPDTPEFRAAAEDAGWDTDSPLGCVWTTLYVGERWGLLELTAATSGMSRLFDRSETVRAMVRDAFAGLAPLVALDREDCVWEPLDGGERLHASSPDDFVLDEPRAGYAFDVDGLVGGALAGSAYDPTAR